MSKLEKLRKMVAGETAAQTAAAQKNGDPNVERFAKIAEAVNNAVNDGYAPGERLARVSRAWVLSDRNTNRMMDHLKAWGNEDLVGGVEDHLTRSVQIGGAIDGVSLTVPEEYASEIIPLLRPYSVLAEIGPREIPLSRGGTIHFPRIAVGASAYWRPPQADSRKAGPGKVGRLTLQEKALTCIVPVPNRLMESASPLADQFFLQDMLASMGVQLDKAHLIETGDEFTPLGSFKYPTDANDPGAVNLLSVGAFTWDLPVKLLEKHMTANGTMVKPVFVFNPTLWRLLMTACVGSNSSMPVWLMEIASKGTILGIPFHYSNHIPTSTSGSKPTSIQLADYNEYLMAVTTNFKVSRFEEATYYDANGNMQSAVANNETVLRTIWAGDMGWRQTKSVTQSRDVNTV